MRICLISGEFPPMQGGVGDYTQEFGQAVADLGHEVIVLTSVWARSRSSLDGPDWRRGCLVFPDIARWDWSFWRVADEFFARQSPDIVNIQYQAAAYGMQPAINLLPWRMRRRGNSRPLFVTTFHDLLVPFLFRGAGPLRRWIVTALARWSDGIITTNEEDAADLARRVPYVPRRLIPIGSNITPVLPADYNRQAWRAHWGIGPAQLALSHFGFVNQSKGGEELIEALYRLVRAGRDAKLLMVGGMIGASDLSNRAYLAQVKGLIESYNLQDRVIWTDYLPQGEVTATLKASDVCVLPYRDGASTRRGTLMAALVHGLPIVTTTPKVPVAHFRDGENMVLVRPRDPDALAGAIMRVADDPALRERISAGAAELARQFTWPAIAQAAVEFYTDLQGNLR